jgi:hypothetical protein
MAAFCAISQINVYVLMALIRMRGLSEWAIFEMKVNFSEGNPKTDCLKSMA